MVDDLGKQKFKLLVNTELEKQDEDEGTVLSQYEMDALLRAVSGESCHLDLVYSEGSHTHISKSAKRRVFMNLVGIYNLPVKSFEQYECIINRPATTIQAFSEFVMRTLRN